MKRWILALVLLLGAAVVAKYAYCWVCPHLSEERCTLSWLRTQLDLTPGQYAQVTEIHHRFWPQIQTHKAAKTADGDKACRDATRQLIDEVIAVLTPAQREKYRKLVSPCSSNGGQGR
jgi:hypothetical protein